MLLIAQPLRHMRVTRQERAHLHQPQAAVGHRTALMEEFCPCRTCHEALVIRTRGSTYCCYARHHM